MERALDTEKRFCSIVLDVLMQKGVRDIVCSPGSRNAPLLIAASAREELRKHIVIDERCAAFMALGIAIVSKKPVALICTSGTALLNYAPAVAEAFYQGIPLIVLSADRPRQWIDQDDSQTLRQFEALSNFVKKSYELPAWGDEDKELQWYANRIANDAMIEALSRKNGPVHINIRLGEPLNGRRELSNIPERVIDIINADGILNKEVERNLAKELVDRKVLLVAGFMQPDDKLQKAVSGFCSLPNLVAMAETLSNLHLPKMAYSVDSVLTAFPNDLLDDMAPDVVISLGGSLVSRKLKEYLRRNKGKCVHWSLGWNHTTSDCFMSLSKRIEVDPARFLRHIAGMLKSLMKKESALTEDDDSFDECDENLTYSVLWSRLRQQAFIEKSTYIMSQPWSEMLAFKILLENIPSNANLFLSNGTAVRYAQILSYKLPHASYCNRGVSGIDGSVSTAVGGAKAYKGTTVLITGDLSMAYDLGALTLPDIPDKMKIIVIDNSGGGIFRFIPTTSSLTEREEYFCASPNLPLLNLAEGYGWNYWEADNKNDLEKSLSKLFASKGKGILRVICDGEKSAGILKGFMATQCQYKISK